MALTLFGQPSSGMPALTSDPTAYTMGVQFSVSASGYQLDGIWFYSPAAAGVLPQTIALYAVTGTSLVTSQAASWKVSPGGSAASAGGGWCFAAFTSPPSLTSGTSYKACILQNTNASFYGSTSSYWTTGGAGASGITNGALSAPANGSASPGQDSYNVSATLTYPGSTFNSTNYWIDPQVSSSTTTVTGADTVHGSDVPRSAWPGSADLAKGAEGPLSGLPGGGSAIPGVAIPGAAIPGNPAAGSGQAAGTVTPGGSGPSSADSATAAEPAAGSLKLGVGKPVTARAWVS